MRGERVTNNYSENNWNREMQTRREFLKRCGGLLASVIAIPVPIFVPPRQPFVRFGTGLDKLYSHLGVLPHTDELNICEGRLLEIADWDGTGFPCLIQNACTFGPNPPRAWIYDFDLWNFRHDDDLWDQLGPKAFYEISRKHDGHHGWYASRRFGADYQRIATAGGGMLSRRDPTIVSCSR